MEDSREKLSNKDINEEKNKTEETVEKKDETVKTEDTKATEEKKADSKEAEKVEKTEKAESEEKSETNKKPDKRDEIISSLQDQVKRQLAEFDNYRKRTDAEKARMYDVGAKEIIDKILPVVDNFERGLKDVTEEDLENDPFKKGMSQIYNQLMDIFSDMKVSAIEALGNEFNPELHKAIMHVEDDQFGENEVIEEFLKGYTYKDDVVRHSVVKVAN